MKPLFIPLKAEYFDAFASGEKSVELRRVNERWNLKKCLPGRPVQLSRGYGKQNRLKGYIERIELVWGENLGTVERKAVVKCYGTDKINTLCIHIHCLEEVTAYCGICGLPLTDLDETVQDCEGGPCCPDHFE